MPIISSLRYLLVEIRGIFVKAGDANEVQRLLKDEADANAIDPRGCALHHAAVVPPRRPTPHVPQTFQLEDARFGEIKVHHAPSIYLTRADPLLTATPLRR